MLQLGCSSAAFNHSRPEWRSPQGIVINARLTLPAHTVAPGIGSSTLNGEVLP